MDAKAKLADIEALIERAKEPLSRADRKREWKTLQQLLAELEGEAERLKLPTANVGEHAGYLSLHLGILLGFRDADGHSRASHLGAALGSVQRMRSAFSRVLE